MVALKLGTYVNKVCNIKHYRSTILTSLGVVFYKCSYQWHRDHKCIDELCVYGHILN